MFALIFAGDVVQTAAAEFPVHASFAWVDISAASPAPQVGWRYAAGVFTAPPSPAAPSLAQQAATMLAAGLAVASAGTPGLDGTYDISPIAQGRMAAVSTYILINGRFPGGVMSYAWADVAGAAHVFPTPASFQAFATAIADHVSALEQIAFTGAGTLPAAAVSIA